MQPRTAFRRPGNASQQAALHLATEDAVGDVSAAGAKYFVLASFSLSLSRFRYRLLCALKASGGTVHVAAPDLHAEQGIRRELSTLGCQCHRVPLARTGLSLLGDARTLVALVRLLARERPTHMLSYTVKPVIYGTLAAWLAGVPKRTALITGLGYLFGADDGALRTTLRRAVLPLYRMALGKATSVVFQNPDDRELFVRLGLVARAKTSVVNGSGIPLDEYPYRSPPPAAQVHFLLIGRLLRDKGVHEYVAAARLVRRRFPHAIFHLVGWIDSNPSAIRDSDLQQWVQEGVIRFHGRLEDVRGMLAACHVYVLPSYREGTPRTVLEAMATGRPVITTDAPGCRETVVDGRNGFLVPPQDAGALAAAMVRFLQTPELVTSMGLQARRLAEEKYDVDKVNLQMLRHMGVPP